MDKKLILFLLLCTRIYAQEVNEGKILQFNQQKWNQIRYKIENNLPLYEEEKSTVVAKPPTVVTPTTIEFIEGTQLTIAGRKLIGVELKTTQYPYRPEYSKTDVNMRQELQVNIHGKVGKNVDVNIDIDDTQPDKRDISIVYRGEGVDVGPGAVGYKAKPGAFIQEAAFGDIQLSLPNTEFVGYSRQVFGLKVVGQYNRARMYLIASQSKGNFETKRFTGRTEFERKILYDTSYIRRKYYKITFDKHKIKKDTLKVYLDTLDPTRDQRILQELTVKAYNIDTATYTGKFELLASGRDYVVDYANGIITFTLPNRYIQPNWVIAVDYVDENTGLELSSIKGAPVMIKDKDETPGITTELLNRYSIGRTNIIRDDGTGNFLLKITDKSDRVLNPEVDKIQPGDKPVPVYKTNNVGDIKVDFENGEIYFDSEKPFAEDCYYKTPISRYNILVEYRYRSKTYFLKPFIVPYSERITLNGRLLERNKDYWIDYDSGFITFLKEEDITESSIIEASYEYSMLGLQGGETIAGGRLELPLANKLFVGSSWIGNLPSKGTSVPDVRSTPSSLQVWETDARLVDFKIPLLPLRINSLSGEYAENEKNPNIWDKAIIENMEGISLEDSVSTYRHLWYYSSCSDVYIPGYYDDKTDKYVGGELNWENENISVKEINPNIESTVDKQQVLKINYNLYSSSEVALVYNFSKYGLDFTKKLYIEVQYYSNAGGGELWLDLGHVSEDIDNDGKLDSEDQNNNGILDINEDTGIEFNRKTEKYYIGKGNGKLDTEDLDGDNIFTGQDSIAGSYKISDLNFTGWVSTRIPVEVSNKTLWSSVKQARLRIKGKNKTGVVKIAKISVVGNRFETTTSQNTKIYAVNNENDPTYKKLTELEEYTYLYGTQYKEKTVEQALAIEYHFDTTFTSSVVNILYSKAQDYTSHHKFNFFLFNKTDNMIIFKIRALTDQNNYFEYSTFTAISSQQWVKFSIEQVDINNDNIPDRWSVPENSTVGGKCEQVGTPNLQAISKLEIVIENPQSGLVQNGIIYVNDIYLSESWKRKGVAKKVELNMSVSDWINFGGSVRNVDRKFETFTTAITNQDNTKIDTFFSFKKLNFLPINFQARQEETITPSAIKSGELVSKLEEGTRLYTEGNFNTSININYLPQLNLNYTKSISSSTALSRTDIKDSLSATIVYQNPLAKYLSLQRISLTYGEEKLLLYPWEVQSSSLPVVDNSRYVAVSLPFNFWDKFIVSFNINTKNTFGELRKFYRDINQDIVMPRIIRGTNADLFDYYSKLTFFTLYNLKTTYDMYYTTYSVVVSSYQKRNEYTVSADSTINLIRFFKPSVEYKMNIIEDYNFPVSDKKDVTRNANGSFRVSFMPREIINIKQIQTLRLDYSYGLTASDKYEGLPKDVYCMDLFSFRNTDLLWYQTEVSTMTLLRKRMLERKDQSLTTNWKLFEGLPLIKQLMFLKDTNITLSYSDSSELKEETQTQSYVYTKVWPNITTSISGLEELVKLINKKQYIEGTKLDLSYTYKTVENKNISLSQEISSRETLSFNFLTKYQIVVSYDKKYNDNYDYRLKLITSMGYTDIIGLQISFPFFGQRLTPRYELKKDYAENSQKRATKDITTHMVTLSYYADIVPQQGITLMGKTLPLQNRLRINSSLSYTRKESPIDIGLNNTDNIIFTARADYDVSKYINITLGTGFNADINRVDKTRTNYSFSLNGQVIIRF